MEKKEESNMTNKINRKKLRKHNRAGSSSLVHKNINNQAATSQTLANLSLAAEGFAADAAALRGDIDAIGRDFRTVLKKR